jgi:drug/metabolite transporter (DMT)-like permease
LLNKRYLGQQDAMAVTWLELGAGFLLLAIISPFAAPGQPAFVLPTVQDGAWLLVLAIFCTLIPFVVSLGALRYLSAFTTQLAINLEPLYAIVLAVLFLDEARELTALFFLGVAIVIAAVFGHGWLVAKQSAVDR